MPTETPSCSRLAANRPSVQTLAHGIRAVERSTHLQRLLPTWQGHQRTITYTCGPTVSRSSDLYTPSAAAHKGRQRWTKIWQVLPLLAGLHKVRHILKENRPMPERRFCLASARKRRQGPIWFPGMALLQSAESSVTAALRGGSKAGTASSHMSTRTPAAFCGAHCNVCPRAL